MLTIEDKKDMEMIVERAVKEAVERAMMIVKGTFDEHDSSFDYVRKELLRLKDKQTLADAWEELLHKHDDRLDRHGDDIRLIKTKLKLA